MNIGKSRSLYKKALKLMPGGVNSPVRAFKSVGGEPLFIKKGAGPHIFDEDDNEFIDYCMSWGPLILGHADDDVVLAVIDAARSGTSFGAPNRYEVELAEMVIQRFPSIDVVRFVNSGTEAAMSAIRLARGFTGKKKIIKFDGCYHGHADSLLVAGGSGIATFGIPDSAGVNPDNVKDTLVVPFNDSDRLEQVLISEGADIAAVIMEPVPCNYGLILPEKGFLKKTRVLCDRYGVLLVFDEVITGFRLAAGGAQEYFGISSDITILGKIIGGGLPVGAYGASRDIMKKIAPDGPVYQAGTLSGNPLAMSAGIATLKKIEETNVYKVLSEKSLKLKTLLGPIIEMYRGEVLLQQIESIFAVFFTNSKTITRLKSVKECDMKLFSEYHSEMLDSGIYLSPSGFEVGFLSSVHTDEDLEKTAVALSGAMAKILG
ncbi:MAG: glutamate-1-semialdehyde 2,1-aminomutase [Spirochaetes bacterium]|nr:glutamate-1-semialdehyde 2,1-aminomutase [Spirochaetota bacterium]